MSTMPPGDGSPPPPPPPPGQPYPSYPASPAYPSAPYYPSAGSGYAEPGPAPGYAYVTFWPRFAGFVIDKVINLAVLLAVAGGLFIPSFVTYYRAHPPVTGQTYTIPSDLVGRAALSGAIATVFSILYYSVLVAVYGRTLGQRAIGATVVRAEDGGKLPGGRAVLRSIVFWAPGLLGFIPGIGLLAILVKYLSLLAVAWDKQKQGWHDKLARSLVVKPWT